MIENRKYSAKDSLSKPKMKGISYGVFNVGAEEASVMNDLNEVALVLLEFRMPSQDITSMRMDAH